MGTNWREARDPPTDKAALLGVASPLSKQRHLQPTTYGRALLDGGTAMFDNLRQVDKNIAFLGDPTAGEVRIGSNQAAAPRNRKYAV